MHPGWRALFLWWLNQDMNSSLLSLPQVTRPVLFLTPFSLLSSSPLLCFSTHRVFFALTPRPLYTLSASLLPPPPPPLISHPPIPTMDATWGSKLGLIADSTLVTVFERNRCRTNGLSSASQDKTIEKNMPRLREGLQQLEEELSQAEQDGSVYGLFVPFFFPFLFFFFFFLALAIFRLVTHLLVIRCY